MTFQWVTQRDLSNLQRLLLVVATLWGIDYLITPSWSIGTALSVVERAFPLWVWGSFFLAAGISGMVGESWLAYCRWLERKHMHAPKGCPRVMASEEHRGWLSYTAHAALVALYSALGLGYALGQITEWHIWGVRAPALMFTFAACHYIFMKRRKRVRVPV